MLHFKKSYLKVLGNLKFAMGRQFGNSGGKSAKQQDINMYKVRRAKLDRWSLDVKVSLLAQLSSLKFVFKMNFVHICLLNIRLRPRRVRIVVAYGLYTHAYGVRIA